VWYTRSTEIAAITSRHQQELEAFSAASEQAVTSELQTMGLELRNKSKEVDKLQKKLRALQSASADAEARFGARLTQERQQHEDDVRDLKTRHLTAMSSQQEDATRALANAQHTLRQEFSLESQRVCGLLCSYVLICRWDYKTDRQHRTRPCWMRKAFSHLLLWALLPICACAGCSCARGGASATA
jgi:hypothetical protein